MKRRDLIAGLLLVPFATPSFAATKRTSILHSGFPNRTPIQVLLEALRGLGYENGSTAVIEVLGAKGDARRLDALVADLAARKPDVIIALTSPAVLALKQAGVVTPVVFAFVTDPVGLGIVASLARPGGNFTGITYSEATLGGKRLELLLDAVPGTRRVAVIWSRSFSENAHLQRHPAGRTGSRGRGLLQRDGGRTRPRACLRIRQRLGRAGSRLHH
jgi:putative tryptophan/tyrosine transport system substrate-binding protein